MNFVSNAKYGRPVESGSIYEGRIGKLIISVYHIYDSETWFLSCHKLDISQKALKSEILMDAIKEAKEILKQEIDVLQKDVNTFYEESIEISRY